MRRGARGQQDFAKYTLVVRTNFTRGMVPVMNSGGHTGAQATLGLERRVPFVAAASGRRFWPPLVAIEAQPAA